MRNTKKLVGLLLALVVILAVGAAMAEGETGSNGNNSNNGSITINDAVVGQTYTIYQILDLESYNASVNAYAYKAATAWNAFINSDAIKGTYVEVDAQGYVTWKDGADAAAFAKATQKYAKDNSIANQGSVTATTTTVSFTGLDLGYYLVDTTLGTLCSLDTTNPNVTMEEKNEVPTNVKTVEEDSTGNYGEKNDADIGQTVNFKSTITAQAGAQNYVFHDKMSAGLTYNNDAKVYTDESMTTELATGNYSVSTSPDDKDTFDIVFTQEYLNTITAETKLYVKYSATLNENAVIAGDGNPNTSKVSYGVKDGTTTNEPSGETPPSKTTTYTWQFDILKYANGDKNTVLKDAKFVLLNSDRSKVATIKNGKLDSWINIPSAQEGAEIQWPEAAVLTTDENGKAAIAGLDADTYYLREIAAPAGYNKLAGDVTVIISPTASEDGKTLTLASVTAEIENKSGTELPSTGGIGTTIFYVIGGVLVIGAAALLIAKRRKA